MILIQTLVRGLETVGPTVIAKHAEANVEMYANSMLVLRRNEQRSDLGVLHFAGTAVYVCWSCGVHQRVTLLSIKAEYIAMVKKVEEPSHCVSSSAPCNGTSAWLNESFPGHRWCDEARYSERTSWWFRIT